MADWLIDRQYGFCADLETAVRSEPESRHHVAPLRLTDEAALKMTREAYSAQLSILMLTFEKTIGTEERFDAYIAQLVKHNRAKAADLPAAGPQRARHYPLLGTTLDAEKYQARVKVYTEATRRGFKEKLRSRMPDAVHFADRLVREMKTESRVNRLTALSYWFAFQAVAPEKTPMETHFMAWAPVLLRTWRPWRNFMLDCPRRFEELGRQVKIDFG